MALGNVAVRRTKREGGAGLGPSLLVIMTNVSLSLHICTEAMRPENIVRINDYSGRGMVYIQLHKTQHTKYASFRLSSNCMRSTDSFLIHSTTTLSRSKSYSRQALYGHTTGKEGRKRLLQRASRILLS